MEFLKSITGRVITGLIALGMIAGAITFWQMDPATREMLLKSVRDVLLWGGVVLAMPWVTFMLISRIAALESNAAGAALVAVYTILETVLLAWLFNWHFPGAAAWTFLLLGGLMAGVYNLLICDWIAEKV